MCFSARSSLLETIFAFHLTIQQCCSAVNYIFMLMRLLRHTMTYWSNRETFGCLNTTTKCEQYFRFFLNIFATNWIAISTIMKIDISEINQWNIGTVQSCRILSCLKAWRWYFERIIFNNFNLRIFLLELTLK